MKNILNKQTSWLKFFAVICASGFTFSTLATTPNEQIFKKMVNREFIQSGIDADMRRMLNDKTFEKDLRKWWRAVNPYYADDAEKGIYFEENYPEVRDVATSYQLKKNNQKILALRVQFHRHLTDVIPSEKVRIYLAYFLQTKQIKQAQSLLQIYLIQYGLYGQEISEDPRLTNSTSNAIKNLAQSKALVDWSTSDYNHCQNQASVNEKGKCLVELALSGSGKNYVNCLGPVSTTQDLSALGSCMRKSGVRFSETAKDASFATIATWNDTYAGPTHLISSLGFIAGNEVQYFTQNRRDEEAQQYFNSLYENELNPIYDFAATIGGGEVDQWKGVWAQEQIPWPNDLFWATDKHPAFQFTSEAMPTNAIFPEIIRAIRSAKHTIFIDVFFYGGTLGAAIQDELIAKAKSGVKIYFLHDMYNAFDYGKEIHPLFNSLLAYSQLHPDQMIAVGSYIMAHRTGMPEYMDQILPDSMVESVEDTLKNVFNYKMPLFPKAKSDHSKVMVIDGAGFWEDATPVAYIGSKNWTDSSGAMTYDEVVKITGPAAIATQDDYYWDFWYALRAGCKGREPMKDAEIQLALEAFDPLMRRWDQQAKRVVPTRTVIEASVAKGEGVQVRLGGNSFDSSVTNALDQNILNIRAAKRQIIVNDQFLYDRRIVEELLEKAKKSPEVKIYIMLEPLSKSSGLEIEELAGFPNNLYADWFILGQDLKINPKTGLLKSMGTRLSNIQFKWKFIPHNEKFHFEYHMKTISVDGFDAEGSRVTTDPQAPAVLITGSANKDHMTMYGSFREMQAEVYDNRPCQQTEQGPLCGAVAEADRIFWQRWNQDNTNDGSVLAGPYSFSIPEKVQTIFEKALGRKMQNPEFIFYMRRLFQTAYELESNIPNE